MVIHRRVRPRDGQPDDVECFGPEALALDGDGKKVAFKKDAEGKADDEFLERLPWQIILEIAGAVVRGGELEDDEVEKSEPSPEV